MRTSIRTYPPSSQLAEFVRTMPKVEVHVHLEGSIQPATLLQLAARHGRLQDLPSQDVAGLQRWLTFVDFPHFVEIYLVISDLLRTPDDFALAVEGCGAAMAAENIRYAEYTFTPFTHTHLQDKGLTIEDLLLGLETGRKAALRQYGVEMRWIFDIPRHAAFRGHSGSYDPVPAEVTLEYALLGRTSGVVGLGLGGIEVGAPPTPFAPVFTQAQAGGLLSVPHAGETVGPESIWGALTDLGAQRIGHGVRAIEDPALLVHLRERQIPLELNLTSNICLHVYRRLAEHPFAHLDRMGLLLTLNSDDPPLFNTSLSKEYLLLASEFGYEPSAIARIARNAYTASAAPPALKARLLGEFDQWLRSALKLTGPTHATEPPSP